MVYTTRPARPLGPAGRVAPTTTVRSVSGILRQARRDIDFSLWDRVQLGASAGLVAPFWRSRFYFLPQVTAFQVPALGFRADSAISVLF